MSVSAAKEPALEPHAPHPTGEFAVPSLAELYGQHLRYVWRCLRSLGVRDSELDDSIQDLFLVVQRRLPEFDGRVSPKTWLYAIAIRIARRYRERHQRDVQREEPRDEPMSELPSAANTEVEFDRNQRLAHAHTALCALDDDKREIFVLIQIEQMSAVEVAEATALPVNTVYSRLRAARAAFADEIKRLDARNRRLR